MALALVYGVVGVVLLVGFAPLLLYDASEAVARGGHLPWPALQWALTTPVGTLVLTACCLMVVGPPLVLYAVWQLRREPVHALDVTATPPSAWPAPRRWPPRPQESASQRWLGHGRRDQALNLTMLILGILLAVTQVGVFVASCILQFSAMGSLQCDAQGNRCAPTFFSLLWMVVATLFIGLALCGVVRARWLGRVEASSRVWLRCRTWHANDAPVLPPPTWGDARGRICGAGAVLLDAHCAVGARVLPVDACDHALRRAGECLPSPECMAATALGTQLALP
jgi:hypothetical protein